MNSPAKKASLSSRISPQLSKPVDAVTTLAGAWELEGHRSDEIIGTEAQPRANWASALQDLWGTEPEEDDSDSGEKGAWRTERVKRADSRSWGMKRSSELSQYGHGNGVSASERDLHKDKDEEIEKRGASPHQGSSTCSSDITRDIHVTSRPGTACACTCVRAYL